VTAPAPLRLAELRDSFDGSFAAPPPRPPHLADLLAIRVAEVAYAVRLSAITALWVDRPTTPLPGPVPELLGLAGFRGTIVPVYDLAALLGHPAGIGGRWLMLAADSPPLALAFAAVDGHLRVPATALGPVGNDAPAVDHGYVSELVGTDQGVRMLINVQAVRASVAAREADSRGMA
jgi:chemotaxis signal transduction protein